MNAGSCQCGAVKFEFESEFLLAFCHCRICQKTHGSAFAPLLHTQAEGLVWKQGEASLTYIHTSEHLKRAFCETCGTPMPIVNRTFNHAAIPAAAMDTPVSNSPQAHFFIKSKAPWFEIGDNAEQYDTVPEGGVGAFLAKLVAS